MNVLVMASTIKMGGAKTIYNQFMSHLPKHIGDDKYLIYVSEWLDRPEISGVEYVIDQCANGAQRLIYEQKHLGADLEKRGFNPDVIISLQNNGYKNIKGCKQIVYYHQALPLYPGWYNPLKRNERKLFYYAKIYPYVMQHTWARNTIFAVQTPVVKKRFVRRFAVNAERVHTFFPDVEEIDTEKVVAKVWNDGKYHFLFVGDGYKYRNSKTLIKAVAQLQKTKPELARKIVIHITNTASNEPAMFEYINRMGVEDNFCFDGRMPHEELLGFYKSSPVLLSSSVIETVGLPMLEAASFGMPVIASDMDFAHNVIGNYEGASFVEPHDVKAWVKAITLACEEPRRYALHRQEMASGWKAFFELYTK